MRLNRWVILGVMVMALPNLGLAQESTQGIGFDPSQNTYGSPTKPQTLVGGSGTIKALTYLTGADDPVTISIRLINWFLGFLGLISMILFLYAGVIWFKARDNEEEITRAKQILKGSLTGLIITLLAYGLAQLLFSQLSTITTKT